MRILAFILILASGFLPSKAIHAANHQIVKTVNGRAITFEAPPGMCAFDPEYQTDKVYLDNMREVNKPENTLVAVFTVCSELERSRNSANVILSDYEIILFPSGSIGKNSIFARADFLREMRTFYEANENFFPEDVLELVREKIADIEVAKAGEFIDLGILASTDEALVSGMTMVVEYFGQRPSPIAGAIAFTVLNGVPITVNLYRNPYEDETTITGLVERVQAHVKTLVAVNADVATSRGGSSIDWSQVFQKALIGGLIGLVVAGVFAIMKAMRKRKT